jgi:hypothetical protein
MADSGPQSLVAAVEAVEEAAEAAEEAAEAAEKAAAGARQQAAAMRRTPAVLITTDEGQVIIGDELLNYKIVDGPEGERIARVFTASGEVESYPVIEGQQVWQALRGDSDSELTEQMEEAVTALKSHVANLSDKEEPGQEEEEPARVLVTPSAALRRAPRLRRRRDRGPRLSSSGGDAVPPRINVSLTNEALAAVSDMAEQRGKTVAEVLHQAIGHEKWLYEEIKAGNRIVVRSRRGRDERELVFEP